MAAEPFIIPAADAGLAKLRALALDRINTANITVTGEKLFFGPSSNRSRLYAPVAGRSQR